MRIWWLTCFAPVIAAILVVLSVLGGGDAHAQTSVQRHGELRWGGDVQGGEPYVYADPVHPERLIGFEVDLANAIARELGVRATFVQCDWSTMVASLERGTFDIALNGLEATPERHARLLLTRPYYVFSERLMVRRDNTFRTLPTRLTDLQGRRVGTLSGSLAFELLRGHAEPVLYEGVEEPYLDLLQGRTDAVLLDDIIAERYGAPKPALQFAGDLGEGYYVIGLRKADTDLHRDVDAALARIIARGEMETILRRAHIWNDRQAKLAQTAPLPRADAGDLPVGVAGPTEAPNRMAAPPPPTFGTRHVWLFAKSAAITFSLSVAAMIVAVSLGLVLALARLYGRAPLRWVAHAYVELYRGTPLLLQLYLLYFGLAPLLSIGAWPAAILGLGMNYAAYEAETYRAGVQAVPHEQFEAALSLGMTRSLALRRVVLPQAVRHALPNITNDFIALLKDSSLVSVITLVELTKQMTITAVDVRSWVAPGLCCALLYFLMSYPLGVLSRRLEKRLQGRHPSEDTALNREPDRKDAT
jgi:polar amino acid transport system substrate-binding protein